MRRLTPRGPICPSLRILLCALWHRIKKPPLPKPSGASTAFLLASIGGTSLIVTPDRGRDDNSFWMKEEVLDRSEWIRSLLLIAVLVALVIILAQSRRECEIPGSSYVPCVPFEKLWQ